MVNLVGPLEAARGLGGVGGKEGVVGVVVERGLFAWN